MAKTQTYTNAGVQTELDLLHATEAFSSQTVVSTIPFIALHPASHY